MKHSPGGPRSLLDEAGVRARGTAGPVRLPPDAPPLRFGEARIGPVAGIIPTLVALGQDPARTMAAVGIDASRFDDPDNGIAFHEVGALLEHAAAATRCPHVGLLAGERFDPESLGDSARLMFQAPSVGEALRRFSLHHYLTDTGGIPMLLAAPGNRAVLGYSVYAGRVPGLTQILDLCAALGVRLLRALCGSSWAPLRVALPRRQPDDPEPYRRILGPAVTFDAELLKVVFASSWLAQPVVTGGGSGARSAPRVPDVDDPFRALPLPHVVRRALRPMVFTGTATQQAMADLLSLHPRSLRRQLRLDGCSFKSLLNDARLDIAQQLLAETDLKVAEVAAAMHYSDATAFTRAFRLHLGIAPTPWREGRERPAHDPHGRPAGEAL